MVWLCITEAANIAERPVVFSSKRRVKRPHKRKPGIVELEAEAVLKKIKANSAKEGAALEKARVPVRKRTREMCCQSKAHCDSIATEFGTELPVADASEYGCIQKRNEGVY